MFLSNGGDYSRDGYHSRKYGNFKYKKKILSTAWKQHRLKKTLFGLQKKRNFDYRLTKTNHKYDKRREKVIKENKESFQKCWYISLNLINNYF